MANTIYDQYLENEILHADSLKLISILYHAAIESVGAAKLHLKTGAIRERSRCITRALEVLNHLMLGLDHSAGAPVSQNLAELYAYMVNRLMEANLRQVEAPLTEVEQLLQTLLQAWDEAQKSLEGTGKNAVSEPSIASAEYSYEGASY